MINAAVEIGRVPGFKPIYETDGSIASGNQIISGKYIRLKTTSSVTNVIPCLGADVIATTGSILGVAADDTNTLPYNGLYNVLDNYYKYGYISAYVNGGLFTVWNDGRGSVFAASTYSGTAVTGAPLYIADATGELTTALGDDSGTIGQIQVGVLVRAPADANSTLLYKAIV
jgi:hypothetical protein